MISLPWRLGVEIELLAPKGTSRRDLAEAIANAHGGSVRRFFHPQSEPSKVPGTPTFHNLTLGFEVVDERGDRLASCVDDLTLQSDLVRQHPPQPGWYRVISDDERLLRLVLEQADPSAELAEVLTPVAGLFGTQAQPGPGGMVKVNDRSGASIAIAAPLPGERERPCELVTAPLDENHEEQLNTLLKLAETKGFTIPQEGATHLHFDAVPFQSARPFANLVQLLWTYAEPLKALMGTNPHCRRLGPWPDTLIALTSQEAFRELSWTEACRQLAELQLTKYCDFNLLNCIQGRPDKNTIEVRILPVHLTAEPLLKAASVFVKLLQRALQTDVIPYSQPRTSSPQDCQELTTLLNAQVSLETLS